MRKKKNSITANLYQTGYASFEQDLSAKIESEKRRTDDRRKRLFVTNYTPSECEELVFVAGKSFETIFGEPDSKRSRHKHTIVKITNPETGLKVYRLFRTSPDIRYMNEEYAAVTYTAIKNLTKSQEGMEHLHTVQLSKGKMLPFYWHHPNPATRISFKLGALGIMITLIAAVLSMCFTLLI